MDTDPLGLFWIVFSYLLGSIPFGYLITRYSTGKDVLEIGWRKTSGSNVFKNVGIWQGVLTGVLDVSKGFGAVWIAKNLGFSSGIQVLSGVAAVSGHNWSLFLRFAGGRGIGTFLGAFLVLDPQILFLSLPFLVLLALVWTASVGTLLFLIAALFGSLYFNRFNPTGIFVLISLVPILLKRLSPVEELKGTAKAVLIKNRLIFDDDQPPAGLRIKKILRGNPGITGGISKTVKFLGVPFWWSTKKGVKAAKLSVKVAKKPIQKLFPQAQEKVVTEIGPEELRNLMVASCQKIVFHQEEINRINVFPIADKDTGYNLAATLLGIEGTITQKRYSTLQELLRDIKEAAMSNARGNAGMIYAGYLIKVLGQLDGLESIDAWRLASAMKKGTEAAYLSIMEPVEGTILDVIKASGETAYQVARIENEKNIIKVLEKALKVSQVALEETKERLEVLKANDVVDAGALGFVKILEAWTENLKGVAFSPGPRVKPAGSGKDLGEKSVPKEGKPRPIYEVICALKKSKGINLEDLKQRLASRGNSLDLLVLEDKIRFHIHTEFPEEVKKEIENFDVLEWRQEDIVPRQTWLIKKKPLGLVVVSTADLPKEFLKKHDIEEVPCRVIFQGEEAFLQGKELYKKMRGALELQQPLPTTSIPSIGDFFEAYQKALEKFEHILVIALSPRISGVYSAARVARSTFKKPEKLNIHVFPTLTAEVGEGLIAMRAQEMISRGKGIEKILEELKKFSPQVRFLLWVKDFRYIVRGGRLRLPEVFVPGLNLLQKIGVYPLVGLKEGRVKLSGIGVGKGITKVLVREIRRQSGNRKIRVAIAHADNPKIAEDLKVELEKDSWVEVLFISSVSPAVGVHAGPGAVAVAFYPFWG